MSTSRSALLARGFTRRCPRCGSGKLFHNYLSMVPDCPRCGLHFEREQGYWAGALAVNIICVGGVFVASFLVAMILTIPDVPVPLMLGIFVPIVAIGPIIWYPFSKTIWVAVDRGFLQRFDGGQAMDDQNLI
jgi:uncharacterized protein (DUF983 family)